MGNKPITNPSKENIILSNTRAKNIIRNTYNIHPPNLLIYPSFEVHVGNPFFISLWVRFMSLNESLLHVLHLGHIFLPSCLCSTWWSNTLFVEELELVRLFLFFSASWNLLITFLIEIPLLEGRFFRLSYLWLIFTDIIS